MTNYEYYRSKIEKLTRMGRKVAVEKDANKIRACDSLTCDKCFFVHSNICDIKALEWADAEYIESEEKEVDWTKIPVDTPILVRDSMKSDWLRRHFSKYEDGTVYAWEDGKTSYTTIAEWHWKYSKLAEVE
jgi:hypothetical protein